MASRACSSPTLYPLLSTLLLCGFVAGCNLVGAAAYKITGPPKVQPQYKPAATPMLVLVENPRQPSAASIDADLVARYLSDELSVNHVAPLIDPARLQALRDAQGSDFAKLSITAIGRQLGAEQVLYVQLASNSITRVVGDEGVQGSATARVRLIDAKTGQTLWPADLSNGAELTAATSIGTDNAASAMDLRQHLYRDLASQIARLFYAWRPEDMRPESYAR